MFDEPNRRRQLGGTVAVAVLAAGYFWLGIGFSVEWVEAGQILYPSWRVAHGALPYRDFFQLYGPSEFFFHGALLARFGADLWVILAALVLVKAAIATLAYAGARTIASPFCALVATALLIAIWGAPVWVFDTPYANHYSTALILAGVLVAATASRRRFVASCAVAGLCCGLAATFKQTAGLLACVGLGLAVVARSGSSTDGVPGAAADTWDRLVRGVRLAFLAGAAALVVWYLAAAGSVLDAGILAAPVVVSIAYLWVQEMRGRGDGGERRRGLLALVAIGSGAALPILAYVGYFAHRGALRELAFNTVGGLPHLIRWFTPMASPPPAAVLCSLAIAGGLAIVATRRSGTLWWIGVVLAGSAAVAIAVVDRIGDGIVVVRHVLTLVMFGAVWGGLACLWADARAGRQTARTDPLAVLSFTAAVAVLLLYPAGDLPHVMMAWPFFVPPIAHVLWRWQCAATNGLPRGGRLVLATLVAGILAALVAPFTGSMLDKLTDQTAALPLARARGVIVADPRSASAAPVVDYLTTQPAGPILVLSGEQMLYFLSGRDSIVAPYEYILYLVGAGAIRAEDARQLLDDAGFATRLETQRPLVIERSGAAAQRLRDTYPQMARILDEHYAAAYRAGTYTILAWTD